MIESEAALTVIVYAPAGVPGEPPLLSGPEAPQAPCNIKARERRPANRRLRAFFLLVRSVATQTPKRAKPQAGSHSTTIGRKSRLRGGRLSEAVGA